MIPLVSRETLPHDKPRAVAMRWTAYLALGIPAAWLWLSVLDAATSRPTFAEPVVHLPIVAPPDAARLFPTHDHRGALLSLYSREPGTLTRVAVTCYVLDSPDQPKADIRTTHFPHLQTGFIIHLPPNTIEVSVHAFRDNAPVAYRAGAWPGDWPRRRYTLDDPEHPGASL